ncbi:MAG: DUF1569 domain-containing protein [Flavobacterium sp.]|nr:MAG: DUF1569 domain-containing protein [Flavobacterium sp.]
MANIFNIESNVALLERIEILTPASKPLWGKMTVAQMLLHCQKPLDIAEGKLLMKRGLIGWLFGKAAKNDFLNKPEFKKNLPTAKLFKVTAETDFNKEKEALIRQVVKFREEGPSVIKNMEHPFFGVMSIEEWGILQYKHLDHHLRQFGV